MDNASNAKQLLEVIPRTMRVIRAEVRALAGSEFSVPQFRILVALSGATLNNCQLAELQGVSTAAMSRMVDGLVRRGLLERSALAEDRRQIQLKLTPEGRKAVNELLTRVQKRLEQRLAALGPDPQKRLSGGLNVLGELFS